MTRRRALDAWLQARRRDFDARATRERLLMLVAGAALAWAIGDAMWVSPGLQSLKAAQTQERDTAAQAQRAQQAAQQVLLVQLQQQRQLQADLKAARERMQATEQSLRGFESTLVGPDRMLPMLEQMLVRHGQVRVRELKSLGRVDLLAGTPGAAAAPLPAAAASAAQPAAGAASAAAPAQLPSLYRHGVEIVLEGPYLELMAYVNALEAMPERVLWGGLKFEVEQHPRAVLRLRLYTLSTARHWIEI